MIKKMLRTIREEGLSGLRRRLRMRALWLLRPSIVRSENGILLKSNWDDATFRYYVQGYNDCLSRIIAEKDEPFLFIDIGANQGLYSLLADRNAHCVKVIAFEPVNQTADLFTQNMQLNGSRVVELRREAISSATKEISVSLDPRHSGKVTIRGNTKPERGAFSTKIRCINGHQLDDIINNRGTGILVKIDVEGLEETVIRELAKCKFFDDVNEIYYEADERWTDDVAIRSFLRGKGFLNFSEIGQKPHLDVHVSR